MIDIMARAGSTAEGDDPKVAMPDGRDRAPTATVALTKFIIIRAMEASPPPPLTATPLDTSPDSIAPFSLPSVTSAFPIVSVIAAACSDPPDAPPRGIDGNPIDAAVVEETEEGCIPIHPRGSRSLPRRRSRRRRRDRLGGKGRIAAAATAVTVVPRSVGSADDEQSAAARY